MPKTLSKRVLILCISLLATAGAIRSQEPTAPKQNLISLIQDLEKEFNIKFSYVDSDLQDIDIQIPQQSSLNSYLEAISAQTQFIIRPLNNRYYTITKSTTIDICARVLDNFEENTIPGATVEILNSDQVIITDAQGRFSLVNVPRDATLRIRHLGFKVLYVPAVKFLNSQPCRLISMGVNYQELEEVVVYNLLTSGLTKQLDGSFTVFPEDFGILPGLIEPDVLQTVQALPGIKSIDETVSNINIRGGTNDQNLVLWDGIKMYQSGHFFGLISAFNPYLTQKVTLIKNGTSAEYGDGVSGIIIMDTNDEIKDTMYGGAGFNLISGDVYAHIPITSRLGFQFSARRSVTDFLNTPTYDQLFNRAFQDTEIKTGGPQGTDRELIQDETFYFYDLSGKLLYDINEDHNLRLNFIHINNDLVYKESEDPTAQPNQSELDQTNLSFGLVLNSAWKENFSTEFLAYYTRYNLDARSITFNGQQELFQNNQVDERAAKVNSNYKLGETLNWLNGYQLSEIGITNTTDVSQPPFQSNVKDVVRSQSLYTEIGYQSELKRVRASGGLRANYIENLNTFTEFILEPRVNATVFLANHLRMEVMGEFKHQVTNQVIDLEQNFLGIEKRRWILSDNTTLPITRSKQASLGINYEEEHFFAGIEGFIKQVNGISTETQGFQNEDQFNGELGSYQVHGVETLVNYKNNDFSSWVSYTFNDNQYTFDSIVPPQFPNNLDIKHSVTLAATYSYRDLQFGMGINYRTGQPYTQPDETNPVDNSVFPGKINYQSANSSRLPDYLRADLSLRYDLALSRFVKASASASVLNVLNRRNLISRYYRLNDSNEVETIESFSLGRTPNLSIRIQF